MMMGRLLPSSHISERFLWAKPWERSVRKFSHNLRGKNFFSHKKSLLFKEELLPKKGSSDKGQEEGRGEVKKVRKRSNSSQCLTQRIKTIYGRSVPMAQVRKEKRIRKPCLLFTCLIHSLLHSPFALRPKTFSQSQLNRVLISPKWFTYHHVSIVNTVSLSLSREFRKGRMDGWMDVCFPALPSHEKCNWYNMRWEFLLFPILLPSLSFLFISSLLFLSPPDSRFHSHEHFLPPL